MVTIDTIPVLKATIVGRQVRDEMVLVLPEQGQVKVLNQVGASIWGWCDGLRTVREIAALLFQEYALDASTAEADTLACLNDLEARGLITALRPAAA